MKVSFLHTLSSNQQLFEPYIATLGTSAASRINHHLNEDLLKNARQISNSDDEEKVTQSVHETLREIVGEHGSPELIVCTCSTIGDMAEQYSSNASSSSSSPKVLRVDRPMAVAAVGYKKIHVLAALESTIQPTMELLQECAQQNEGETGIPPKMQSIVVPDAWTHFQAGDRQGYAQTIANYIVDNYQNDHSKDNGNNNNHDKDDLVLVLAQASMSPAASLVEQMASEKGISSCLPRILTSPGICMDYLRAELEK